MPLMKGKSQGSFGHNVKAEMHAGKPQKQALAIAYAVRRRTGKKMAAGGMVPDEDMGREYYKYSDRGEQTVQDNEELNPKREPEQGAKNAMYKQMDYSKKAQEHEDLEESKVDPGSINAYRKKSMELRKEPSIAQAKLPTSEQAAFFAGGGIVGEAMTRRQRAVMAAMGKYGDTVKHMSALNHDENEGATRKTGPSGFSTPEHDRTSHSTDNNGYPQKNIPLDEQAALLADGGLIEYPDPLFSKEEQDMFYADGGMTGNEISSPRKPYAELDMKEFYPYAAKEEEGEHFAKGGMFHPKMLAQMVAKKKMGKMYAEGGPVDQMGLQDQEYDQDRFLAEHMEPIRMGHSTALDSSDELEKVDPKQKKKHMISSIMSGLHKKHLGK